MVTHGVETADEPAARPVFAVGLLLIAGSTFLFVDVGLGLALAALFGIVWWLQTSDVRAGR